MTLDTDSQDEGVARGFDPRIDEMCNITIETMELEEVAQSEYYRKYRSVPTYGTRVRLRRYSHGPRLEVETESGEEEVGLAPTQFDFLRVCQNSRYGYAYSGTVLAYSANPPQVTVRLQVNR